MFAMIALAACLSSSIEAPPPPVPPLRPFVQDHLKVREAFGPLIGASLDEVLGDALTRRLLPRGVLHPSNEQAKRRTNDVCPQLGKCLSKVCGTRSMACRRVFAVLTIAM